VTGLLLFASTGSAQTFDVSGGWAYRNEAGLTEDSRLSIEKGWFGAAGFNINDSFGVFGQLSQHSESDIVAANDNVKLFIIGGGPRVTGNQRASVTYFAQALFGRASLKAKLSDVTIFSDSRFAFQPAVGVDVKAGGVVGVRFEFAPTYIKPDADEDAWAYHLMIGIVVRGG
jgi:Outer membrane protein beta-barrel domain